MTPEEAKKVAALIWYASHDNADAPVDSMLDAVAILPELKPYAILLAKKEWDVNLEIPEGNQPDPELTGLIEDLFEWTA